MSTTSQGLLDAMRAEKRKVARHSIYAAVAITAGKLVVGFLSGSLGILSEALNSALDLVMTVLTFVSVRVSDKPPDADHMYGHGKAENLTAFMQMGLLLGISLWIIAEAVRRLFFTEVRVGGVWSAAGFHRDRSLALAGAAAGGPQIREPGAGSRCAALPHRHVAGGGGDHRVGVGAGGAEVRGAVAGGG
jgi:hypothetical protein